MANRQSAPAGIRADARENAARLVMHQSALPGWFWGMLGCLSVLGVGFGILIIVARNGLFGGGAVGPTPATTAAPTTAAPATAPAGSRPRPQIEQLVPPSARPLTRVAKPKPQTHAIKLARSPSGGHPVAADEPANDTPGADSPGVDKPGADKPAAVSDQAAVAKKPTDKASGDDDQVVRHRKTAASDDDDDN